MLHGGVKKQGQSKSINQATNGTNPKTNFGELCRTLLCHALHSYWLLMTKQILQALAQSRVMTYGSRALVGIKNCGHLFISLIKTRLIHCAKSCTYTQSINKLWNRNQSMHILQDSTSESKIPWYWGEII